MFRAAHCLSSRALNCICSLWFICPYGSCQSWVENFLLSLGNGWSRYGHINQRLQIQFRAPDDKQYAARNMLSFQKIWNNKFYYKAASGISTDSYDLRCTDPWVSNRSYEVCCLYDCFDYHIFFIFLCCYFLSFYTWLCILYASV
jgi:hypothetical protein